ncbi:MAG: GAF domain-containing protein, partial [Sulfuricellaceae bacterium]|nr:GAF domain-containing protein [Sulfuricellaceae bacterium]
MFLVFTITFTFYVHLEKQIDRANELQHQSYLLADELRQSSDDLTRMVRSYVVTGNPIYKRHYQEILDIRDGKKPRPVDYQEIYWDLVLADDQRPRPSSRQTIPLLELMRQAGFTAAEFAQLAQAKANSDALTRTEFAAMKLAESTGPAAEAKRRKASLMLNDAAYYQAKAGIMRPIGELYRMMNRRTRKAVHSAEAAATLVRWVFILFGLLLLFMLWRAYRTLQATLGAPLDELYARIARLGSGDFSSSIPIAKGMENSVLSWLSTTQIKLAQIDSERKNAEARNQRLTQLYAALSQCNQAIVRCASEAELFPQICRDAVNFGGMKMAWIGLLDEQSKLLKPVASYGSGTEYLEGLQISVGADDPSGRGPSGTAIRENQPIWCQDFQHDPATA